MPAWWSWNLDGWIVAAAVLCAMSCALLGNFMVLRRMSMMGDAISHAVLPGLAAAFLLTGSRGSFTMLAGAAVVGVLTAVLTQAIAQVGKVEESASMGVVFTSLFALGLILIRQAADHVDLDPGCVLYGVIESVPLEQVRVAGLRLPRVVIVLGVMFAINSLFVLLCYKELRISSFDPALATTLGINAHLMHYLLMTLVAATTVASFEAVGSILVVAMLIVPPATAYLLTDRLGVMILLSLVLAALSGVLGHVAAIEVPSWFGYRSTTTAGSMATVAGVIFLAVMMVAPRHGVLSKLVSRLVLSMRIAGEDILGLLYRMEEVAGTHAPLPRPQLQRLLGGGLAAGLVIAWVRQRGRIERTAGGYRLTESGREQARSLLRSHRLWENYLVQAADVPADHSHESAERLEHVTGSGLQQKLGEVLQGQERDPHGKAIPGR